jgi:hypothetical protein
VEDGEIRSWDYKENKIKLSSIQMALQNSEEASRFYLTHSP